MPFPMRKPHVSKTFSRCAVLSGKKSDEEKAHRKKFPRCAGHSVEKSYEEKEYYYIFKMFPLRGHLVQNSYEEKDIS